MNKIIATVTCCLITFTAISCKKKKGENEKLDPNKNTTIEEYMSTKVGSWWLYSTSEGKILKRTATGTTKEKDGFNYDLYKIVDTTSTMKEEIDDFFAKNEDSYISLIDLDGSQTNYIRAIIYKDNAKVGDKWTNTGTAQYSGINLDIEVQSEITSLYETKVINGVTFDSVCVTHNKLRGKQGVLIPWTSIGSVELWFRKGIGILKRDMDIKILTFYSRDYEDQIIGYHIEK